MSFSTADLCDCRGDEIQIADPVFRQYGGVEHCFGRIRTIELDEDNSELVKMLRDEEGHGDIAVVDVKGAKCAVVGDTLMGYAHKNGWSAIVINGYVRDTKITSNIPVGLWALGTYPLKSSKKAPARRDVELTFASVTFRPGEYLYADHDGIVVMRENAVDIDCKEQCG